MLVLGTNVRSRWRMISRTPSVLFVSDTLGHEPGVDPLVRRDRGLARAIERRAPPLLPLVLAREDVVVAELPVNLLLVVRRDEDDPRAAVLLRLGHEE